MCYVYVLKSKKNGIRYIGSTCKEPIQRLKEHNSGANVFTKNNRPYDLIYYEEHEDKAFALKRERFFKTGNGRSVLNRILKKNNDRP